MSQPSLHELRQAVFSALESGDFAAAFNAHFNYKVPLNQYLSELYKDLKIVYDRKANAFKVRAVAPIDVFVLSSITDTIWNLDAEGNLSYDVQKGLPYKDETGNVYLKKYTVRTSTGEETIEALISLGATELEEEFDMWNEILEGVKGLN